MFFELRDYPILSGKRAAFIKWMDEVVIPYQLSKGMIILGTFVDEENDRYIWIRRFESENEREALYEATYRNDYWRKEISPQVDNYIDRDNIKVTILKATLRSFMQ